MSARHVVLAAAAALVLGLGVYLFREVNATPVVDTPPRPAGPTVSTRGVEPGGVEPHPEAIPDARRAVLTERLPPNEPSTPTDAGRPHVTDDLAGSDDGKPNARLDAAMSEANKAYDRGDFDDAKAIAQKVLAKTPGNTRMLRILVSASCIDGDNDTAQNNFLLLPVADREQMKQRCARYGVTFTDK